MLGGQGRQLPGKLASRMGTEPQTPPRACPCLSGGHHRCRGLWQGGEGRTGTCWASHPTPGPTAPALLTAVPLLVTGLVDACIVPPATCFLA